MDTPVTPLTFADHAIGDFFKLAKVSDNELPSITIYRKIAANEMKSFSGYYTDVLDNSIQVIRVD